MSAQVELNPSKGSRSLTATLAIAFVTLSVVTLLLAGSLELYFNIRSQQEVVAGEQRLIAQSATNEVASFIQKRFGELESIVKFSGLIDASADVVEQTLEQLLGQEPTFRQLALLDEQGRVVARASRFSQAGGNQVTGRLETEALAQTKQDERYIGPVYIDDETFEPLIVMAVPVVNVFGDYQGTLVAEANLKFMWDLVNRLEIGDEGVAYVVDRQGNLLAFEDQTQVIAGKNLRYLEEVAEFVEREDARIELEEIGIDTATGIRGNNVLATYVPLGSPDWAVVTELPVAEAYRGITGNVIIFVAIIIIAALLAGGAGAYMARRLATPVQNLTDTAAQIAGGNLHLQAGAEGPTEIRQLAAAFNQMTGQLNDLIQSLEERVQTRTQRLETIATLSGQLVTILNIDQLVSEMVNQIKDQFGYYHAQTYLVDKNSNNLRLAGATGQVGQIMVAQGHTIPMGQGIVGRAAQKKETVLAPNLTRVIAPEVITAKNINAVYQRETDAVFRSQWYHNYIARVFGSLDDLTAGSVPADGKLRLGFALYDLGEFSAPIVQGAQDAARDLGVDIEIVTPYHSDRPDELVGAFDKLIAAQKDGLAVFPQFQSIWPPYFNKAAKAGIPVVLVNLTGPDIADYTWFGQDSYQGGFALAIEFKQFLQNSQFQSGEIVVGISGTREPGHVARYDGFKEGLAGTAYTVSELFYSDTIEPEADHDRWVEFIETRPNLIAAVGITGHATPVLSKIKTETNADWLIAGFDLETATLEALKNDVVQVAVAQHPYLQGYLPVLALVQYLQQDKPLSNWVIEDWLPNPLLPETKSEISVPIMLKGQVEGVLDVQLDKADALDESDAALLQLLANQVAVGIRNAQQFEQVQKALAKAEAIQEQYMEQAWDKSKLNRFTSAQAEVRLTGATSPAGDQAQTPGIVPVLTAPIELHQGVIGRLELEDTNPQRVWSEDELALVNAVVDQVAQAAENLRLFEETRERAGREQTIREITDKLRAAPSIDLLLETAARELGQRLGVPHTVLELGIEAVSNDNENKGSGIRN